MNCYWFQVRNSEMTRLGWYVQAERGGLETSLLELETVAVALLFREGRLTLRCLASQFSLYQSSSDMFLHEDTPQLAHVLGPSLRNTGTSLSATDFYTRLIESYSK